MASEALRRLAGRIRSTLPHFGGDNGDDGDSVGKAGVFVSPNGAALGDNGDSLEKPDVTNVTNVVTGLVAAKPAELADVTNVTDVTAKSIDDRLRGGPDPKVDAHLAQLSAAATAAFTGSPDGTAEVRTHQPDGSWSAPTAVRAAPLQPLDSVPAEGRQAHTNEPANVVRLRSPSWSDIRDEPQQGDRCHRCGTNRWWIEGGMVKRGWRCAVCHASAVSFGVRLVQT